MRIGFIVEAEKKGVVISHYFENITDALLWLQTGYTASLDDDQDGEIVKYCIYQYDKDRKKRLDG